MTMKYKWKRFIALVGVDIEPNLRVSASLVSCNCKSIQDMSCDSQQMRDWSGRTHYLENIDDVGHYLIP